CERGLQAALTVLQVLRADPRHQPLAGGGRGVRRRLVPGPADAGQGELGGLLVVRAADALAVRVAQGDAFLGAGRGVVPAVGLLPVPGGAVGLAAGLLPAHGWGLRCGAPAGPAAGLRVTRARRAAGPKGVTSYTE